MKVKENIEGETYKKLMVYLAKKCDAVSFTYRPDQHQNQTNKEVSVILSNEKCTKEDIIKNYSKEYLKYIFEKYRDNCDIFDENFQKKYEWKMGDKAYKEFKEDFLTQRQFKEYYNEYGLDISFENMTYNEYEEFIKYDGRMESLNNIINYLFYNYNVEKFINKYKNDILSEERVITKYEPEKGKLLVIRYYIKVSNELIKDILDRKSIYDWCFPRSIEDIEFYKDGYSRLLSVAHENILEIFCESEEEYEYLKSIGIKFEDKKFIPVTKEEKIYYDYKSSKNTVIYY